MAEANAIILQGLPKICSGEKALGFARYMGKAMPTGEGTDFDVWFKDAAIIFSEYAEEDVRLMVEHPMKGIRAKQKWLPQPVDLIDFLNDLRNRHGRIMSNARYVVAELTKEPKPDYSPGHKAAMTRKLENLARELTNRRSLDAIENTQAEQEIYDAECLAAGNGDKQRGIEVLLELVEASSGLAGK